MRRPDGPGCAAKTFDEAIPLKCSGVPKKWLWQGKAR